jgi:hypothetical protein
MSILSKVTSILEPSKWNNDHRGGDDYWKNGDKDDYSKHDGDYSKHDGKDDYSKHGKDDYSKHAKNDDCPDDGRKGDYSKHADKDDYSKHGKDDYSKHDGGWKDTKNDDCQPHKDYCQPQKDYCAPKPSDDCGKGDTHHNYNPGEALAKLDFSHGDFGSHGPDHSGEMQGALASMSSGHALDYAIGQMGPDHFDPGHFDMPTDTHHDVVHQA